ncbi:TauD/TfdA family dioxygenase [Pseudomonas sp. Z5-35]|uniref:TauD/TfdA family dioxygenase n=1 Tax=unclassified Pseudomonas TaxID=196821 RepID=UPI003DA89D7F
MSRPTITPLSIALGAQISGIDISQPLSQEQRDTVEQALLDHQVLFFRDQPIEPQQQTRFAAYFGDLHIHPIYPNVPDQPEVLVLDTAVTDVRDNPVSGRRSLFVNEGFTTRINELSETESGVILKLLFAHATRPEFTLRWRWQVNDVAFWDNRVTQHFAVDDYRPARRVMHRATVLGDVPFFR